MLVRSKLRCPRCGAELKPTVPWHYVRILLILLIVLALVLTFIVSQGNLPLLVLFAIVGLLLWFAPRLIHFEPVGPELNPSEGVLDPQDWRMRVEDRNLEERLAEAVEKWRFRWALSVVVILGLLLTLAAWFYQSF
jgi:hypothetical protein